MKKILSLFMIALFATAMVSCNKEDNGNPSGNTGGGGSIPELVQNMLIVGSQQYQLQPTLKITSERYYLFSANDPNGHFDIIADVPEALMNRTVDLAQLEGVDRFYINFTTTGLSFALQTGTQPISAINGESVDAVFSQGTMQLINENGVFSLCVVGTLSNGTNVGFMMSIPMSDIRYWTTRLLSMATLTMPSAWLGTSLVLHSPRRSYSIVMMAPMCVWRWSLQPIPTILTLRQQQLPLNTV